MEAHEYYKKETGKLYYKEAALELELTDDYINWLERNVVKLFAIPVVVGRREQLPQIHGLTKNKLNMKIKIERLNADAIIPKYAKVGDAGMDLVATSRSEEYNIITYGTGLAIEIPKGYVGLLFPRSSIYKTDLSLTNSVGVIDSGYRGEIKFKFKIDAINSSSFYNIGERVGQLLIIPYPQIEFEEVAELSDSERGTGGFGSTGK